MTGKTAIVGDGDSITVFKAAGVDAYAAENEKQGMLPKLKSKNFEVRHGFFSI